MTWREKSARQVKSRPVLLQLGYLPDGTFTDPEEEDPVVPEVPELLDVPALPFDGVVLPDEEPEDDPKPEEDPEVEPMPLGAPPVVPDEVAPVVPDVPEPLDVPALPPDADGDLEEDVPLSDGEILPVEEPDAEPIPEAEPEAEPLALGPDVLHAAKVNAQANGKIHLVMIAPWSIKILYDNAIKSCIDIHIEIANQ